jgi:hypothetical protein
MTLSARRSSNCGNIVPAVHLRTDSASWSRQKKDLRKVGGGPGPRNRFARSDAEDMR